MPAKANDTLDKTRRLQIKLYLAVERNRYRRFHAPSSARGKRAVRFGECRR